MLRVKIWGNKKIRNLKSVIVNKRKEKKNKFSCELRFGSKSAIFNPQSAIIK